MTAISPLAARLGTATPDSADGSFTEDSDTAANSRQQTPSPVRNGFETPVTESPSTTVTASSFAPAGLAGLSTTVTYTGTSNVTADVGEDGVLHIRPIPTRKGRKIKVKKVVNFVPRISTFDRFHTAEQTQSFWGFYVLFWLMMSLVLLRMFYHSYLNSGVIVGLRFAKLISADGVTLALSDAALVGTTVLAVPFVQVSHAQLVQAYSTQFLNIAHATRLDPLSRLRRRDTAFWPGCPASDCHQVDVLPRVVLGAEVKVFLRCGTMRGLTIITAAI